MVPHRSTDRAQWCLTSQFGWDAVYPPWCDRMMGCMVLSSMFPLYGLQYFFVTCYLADVVGVFYHPKEEGFLNIRHRIVPGVILVPARNTNDTQAVPQGKQGVNTSTTAPRNGTVSASRLLKRTPINQTTDTATTDRAVDGSMPFNHTQWFQQLISSTSDEKLAPKEELVCWFCITFC